MLLKVPSMLPLGKYESRRRLQTLLAYEGGRASRLLLKLRRISELLSEVYQTLGVNFVTLGGLEHRKTIKAATRRITATKTARRKRATGATCSAWVIWDLHRGQLLTCGCLLHV